MPTKVLLSIKPEFAAKIFNGTKRFEFRRKVFRNRSIKSIVVYASAPICKVVGEFNVLDILELETELLWHITKDHAGITKSFFDEYFTGYDIGCAIEVGGTQLYKDALGLEEAFQIRRAPQSFMYLEELPLMRPNARTRLPSAAPLNRDY